jgi:hypothetical protein
MVTISLLRTLKRKIGPPVIVFSVAITATCFDLTAAGNAEEKQSAASILNSRIAIASGVRLRSAPSITASEITRLQFGAIVQELERTPSAEKIGGVEDYWYRVATADGQQGWAFGSLVVPFDPSRKADTYRRIVAERLKVESASFTDLADLARFLSVATTEVAERDARAELELATLLAMKRAAASIPIDQQKQPQYQTWIKAQGNNLVYSEEAGQWLVWSDLFWELHKKESSLPIADRIAWEAARNPLPGECEGYLPCHFSALNHTDGKYLELYPRGVYAEEALKNIAEDLGQEGFDTLTKSSERPPAEERGEAIKELAKLRPIVMKAVGSKKAKVLELISGYEKYYR